MASQVGLAVGAVGVLAAAGIGFSVWRHAQAAAARRAALLGAVETALAADPVERGELLRLDRALEEEAATDPSADVLRALTRLALALRLPERGWRQIEALILAGRAGAEDKQLGVRCLVMRQALSGDGDAARRAISLGEELLQSHDDPETALLVWQCAQRIDDQETGDRMAEHLAKVHAGSIEARVVAALRAFHPDTSDLDDLRALALEQWIPELELALAAAEANSDSQSLRLQAAERVRAVLAETPASKPARLVAVLAMDRIGDRATRDAHLAWLLQTYPDDPRAEQWQAQRGR